MDKLIAFVASKLPDQDLGVIESVANDLQIQIDGRDPNVVPYIDCPGGVRITVAEAKEALK